MTGHEKPEPAGDTEPDLAAELAKLNATLERLRTSLISELRALGDHIREI